MNEFENDKTTISLRSPTKRMVERLKECLEKQSQGRSVPCLPEDMKSSMPGLYQRGFITTRMQIINQKRQLCIYITESGRKFLLNLDKKKPADPSMET